MEVFNVTDANGKDISFTLDQLTDMDSSVFANGSHNVCDSEKITKHEVSIVDSDGNVVDFANLTDEEVKGIKAIDVTYEATHSGDNRNYAIYHSDSMEKDAQSWKAPYPKPFIKNHDIHSEPMGRVIDFNYGQSEFNNERDAIDVTWRITDQEAIPKFLDGRYHTMSIGAKVGHLKCNICGKDILKDGKVKFCGHWKGETYGTQKALWHARDLEYREGSVVNAPADDWAQVKKIVVLKDEPKKSNDENEDDTLLNDMDNIINDSDQDNQIIDNSQEEIQNDNPTENPITDEENQTETLTDIELRDKEIERLTQIISDKDVELEKSQSNITDLETQISEITQCRDSLKDDVQKLTTQSIKLAKMNKSLMVDKIVDCEYIKKTIEDKEARHGELIKLTSKELHDMYKELDVNDIVQRTINTVSNPSLVDNNDSNVIKEDNDIIESKITLKDIEESVINNILR